eukprot:CAMPEP_0118959656 /NCGR_PEP_ID=MMETSP1169-20130426/63245_1 /TAXON_ID=36882 /ORGANISM="Pyramimonas obovata, Strain CCMP722" /LENGTH=149 /DNA_ID=CAMNT_0006907795 /DNA_START=652 /DNA_END=1098 /DNA_ORIENTATION=-
MAKARGNWKDRGEEFFKVEEDEPVGVGRFNDTLTHQEAVLETVARVKDEDKEANRRDKGDKEDTVARLIDSHDNEYILTKPHKGISQMELREDFVLISDLVKVIVAAAIGGLLAGLLKQPVMLGYLVAGSLVGPGGLGLIDELVQVETL